MREFLSPLDGRGDGARRALPSVRAGRHPLAAGRDAQGRGGRPRHRPRRRGRREDRAARRARASTPSSAGRARTAAALASTLGLRPPGDPLGVARPARALPRAGRRRGARCSRRSRRRARVVAVVEDLHWADPTMLDVLDELAERLDGPILFLCTGAPRPAPLAPRLGRRAPELQLAAARPAERRGERAARLAPARRRRAARRRAPAGSSSAPEGNPFFLEEIVRHLIDEGLLVREDGRWRARAGIDERRDPGQRPGRHPRAARPAGAGREARRAARGGRRPRLLGRRRRRARAESTISTPRCGRFAAASSCSSGSSSSIAGQSEFIFKHVLIRDVAYASLPRRERGRAHAETAAWIEETSGERTGELAELLAHHYDAAFSFLRDDDLRRRARAPPPRRGRERAPPLRDPAGRAPRAARGRALRRPARSGSRRSRRSATSTTSRSSATPPGARTARRSRSSPTAIPRFARLAGKAALFGARWLGTMHELPPTSTRSRAIVDAWAARGARRRPGAHAAARRPRLPVRPARGVAATRRPRPPCAKRWPPRRRLGDPDLLSAALDLVARLRRSGGRYGRRVPHDAAARPSSSLA